MSQNEVNPIDPFIAKLSKSICELTIETKSEIIKGIGFLLKDDFDQENFYYLITNEQLITNDIINHNNSISISFNNGNKIINIKLNDKRRYIKSFKDIGLDITAIELLEEDNIPHDYFLLYENESLINNGLIKNEINILHYNNKKDLIFDIGEIKEINNHEFIFKTNKVYDSLGILIFLEKGEDVLGIYKRGNKNKMENYADFIAPVFDVIKNDIQKKRDNGKYLKGKFIWDDGKYYIGEFKYNLPNGKGIKYYSNGNILYQGDFINSRFEGNGKYIYDNGDYYIGQYKNGLRNGKGIKYYKNGNIMYEANFINGKGEGEAKYIYKNGEYFIGEFKNNLQNGKGKEYYKNGKIKYEGDYVNNRREGYGKYFWENGEYFIGQYKNNFPNGKGKEYYSNGKIKFEGNFINDRREGNGKYYWKNGEYYIGQWKNGLRHGKGIQYYSNGKIAYEGERVNDKINGYGKYTYLNNEYYIGQFKNYLKHGQGTLYDSNGKIKNKGKWINDEIVIK